MAIFSYANTKILTEWAIDLCSAGRSPFAKFASHRFSDKVVGSKGLGFLDIASCDSVFEWLATFEVVKGGEGGL